MKKEVNFVSQNIIGLAKNVRNIFAIDDIDEQTKQDEKKEIALEVMKALTTSELEDLIEILAMTDISSSKYLSPHDEYYNLINQDCYAPSIIGRKLTQPEINQVVAICDDENDACWGEEHLIEVLRNRKELFN
jgi:hypothetical protein